MLTDKAEPLWLGGITVTAWALFVALWIVIAEVDRESADAMQRAEDAVEALRGLPTARR